MTQTEKQVPDQPTEGEPSGETALSDESLPDPAVQDEAAPDEAAPGAPAPNEIGESEADEGPGVGPGTRRARLENEGDIAADFLEELLDIADLDGDIDMDVDGNRAAVSIVGGELSDLVGDDGAVLEALQELTRLAVFRETGERSRLMLDVAGYRQQRREALIALATVTVTQVRETGEPRTLEPMTPFERKVVHDAVAAAGLRSESDGVEPHRCVVISPAAG